MSVQPITTSPPGARDAGPSSPDGGALQHPVYTDGASVVLRGVLSKRSTQHFLYQQRTFTLCAGADGVVHSLRYRSKDGGAVVIGAADITGVSVVDEAKHGFVVDVDAASAAVDLAAAAGTVRRGDGGVGRTHRRARRARAAPSARRLFAAADDAAAAADDAVTESSLPSEPPDGGEARPPPPPPPRRRARRASRDGRGGAPPPRRRRRRRRRREISQPRFIFPSFTTVHDTGALSVSPRLRCMKPALACWSHRYS